MLFNVAQLLRELPGAQREYPIDAELPATADGVAAAVRGAVRLMRTNRGLMAYADLDAATTDQCARCLRPVDTPLRLALEEEFLPTVDVNTGAPLPPAAGNEGAFLIDDHHHLDLTVAVRQGLVVALPMQTLCREECAGLCPECGADRNQGACTCPPAAVDSPWAALQNLKLSET